MLKVDPNSHRKRHLATDDLASDSKKKEYSGNKAYHPPHPHQNHQHQHHHGGDCGDHDEKIINFPVYSARSHHDTNAMVSALAQVIQGNGSQSEILLHANYQPQDQYSDQPQIHDVPSQGKYYLNGNWLSIIQI